MRLGNLEFMDNSHVAQGWNLRTRVAIVNHKSQTMCYILDCSLLLLVNIRGSLHYKQGSV